MEFRGITEILGCKGTGKTTYILNMLKDTKVAYFTTKKLPITLLKNIYVQKEIPLTNLHINVVFDIYKLKHIYLNTLNGFIAENEIKAVVIDTFDSLFTTVHDADKKNELFALMDVIREVCFRHKVSTFLIQEFPRKTDPYKSYVMRYDIKYMINKQISLTKNNAVYTIRSEDFVNGVKCTLKFKICNNAIEYVHEASNGDVHLEKPFQDHAK